MILKHLRSTVSKAIKPTDKTLDKNSEANRMQHNLNLVEGISVLLFKNLKPERIPKTTILTFLRTNVKYLPTNSDTTSRVTKPETEMLSRGTKPLIKQLTTRNLTSLKENLYIFILFLNKKLIF